LFTNQVEYEVRCEWGLEGITALVPDSDVMIIVDVISFSTCVTLAAERGAWVFPYRWKDERSEIFAGMVGAILATASRTDPTGFSLAPSSMLRLPPEARVVLPSPNGATLSLATSGCCTFTACLRNAQAVAAAAQKLGSRVSIIPAGERWRGGGLRLALEDWIGAGAIIHHLPGRRSPEAAAAEALFEQYAPRLGEVLLACSSGKEAAARGSPYDVELAAQVNCSRCVPQLIDGSYRDVS
jgi:2-phosphosulfolactate phosphatase